MHCLRSVRVSSKTLNSTTFTFDRCPEIVCRHIKLGEDVLEDCHKSGITKCEECRTEFRIEYKDYESCGKAMFFMRWKDLGSDPDSDIWDQHLPRHRSKKILADLWEGFLQYDAMGWNGTGGWSRDVAEREPQAGDIARAFGNGDAAAEFDSWRSTALQGRENSS